MRRFVFFGNSNSNSNSNSHVTALCLQLQLQFRLQLRLQLQLQRKGGLPACETTHICARLRSFAREALAGAQRLAITLLKDASPARDPSRLPHNR
jgi:hypothetical protein